MRKRGIKNLLIDFGGVLINLDRQRCIDNFKTLGIQNLDELLGLYHQEGFFMQFEQGLISPEDFRGELRKLIDHEVTDEQIDEAWNSFLVDVPTYKLDYLLKLREKYVVYLLSNTNQIHWEWSCQNVFPYRGFRVTDYFEKMFLSFEMKMTKPNPDIFKTVIMEEGLAPKETFFIDDSPENCSVAQSLGIETYTPQAKEDWGHLFNF